MILLCGLLLCLVYFLAGIKYPSESNLRTEGLFWFTVWGPSPSQWKSHGNSRSRCLQSEDRKMSAAQFTSSFLCSEVTSLGNSATHGKSGPYTPI